MLTVCMTTLIVKTRRRFASEFTFTVDRITHTFFYMTENILAELSVCVVSSPIYETYCIDHYADGRCDQGCNTEECGWDGLDCAGKVPEVLADGVLVLVVLLPPHELLRTSTAFLQKLSAILHTTLRFRLDDNGEAMIRPYTRKEARLKRELQPHQEVIGSVTHIFNIKPEVLCADWTLY